MNLHKLTPVLSFCAAAVVWANTNTSVTDTRTPAEVAVGTPAGSYALGNLESYNPYNGSFNIHIPVYKVGWRGEAGYTICSWGLFNTEGAVKLR